MAAPDGGWGWAVVFGSALIFFLSGGIERSFGVWYVDILERYEAGAALTSWCIGVHATCRQVFFLFAAVLYARTSARCLVMIGGLLFSTGVFVSAFADNIFLFYASFGLVGGLGSGMATFAVDLALSEYFDRRKFLAMGLALCGSGIGGFTLSILLTNLLLSVSYFETVVIVSGIVLQSLIGGAVCFPIYELVNESGDQQSLPEEHKPLINKEKITASYSKASGDLKMQVTHTIPKFRVRKLVGKRNFEIDILRNPLVILYAIGAFLSVAGSFPIPQLVVDHAIEKGVPFQKASLILTITAFLEIFTRLALGFILNLPFVRPRVIFLWHMSYVGFGVSALAIAFASDFWHFILSMFINMVSYAFSRGFTVVLISSVFEPTAFTSVFAVYNFIIGLGTLCGTVFTGFLKDISGSYFISYLVMAFLCFFSSCFYFLNHILLKKLRNNPRYRLLKSST